MDTAADVLGLVKSMEDVGFSRPQAELLSALQAALVNGHLATKDDISALRSATKADIEALRISTKADIEALRLSTKSDIDALRVSTKSDIALLKSDIEALRVSTKSDIALLKSDIEGLRVSTKSDIDALRLSTKSDIALVKSDIEALRTLMEFRFTAAADLMRRDLETMQNRMTVRLGSIVIASVVTGSAVVALLGRFLGAHP